MTTGAKSEEGLADLARDLGQKLEEPQLGASALGLAGEHAADGRLALASMLTLAEESAPALREMLQSPERARSLVFCLGASEVVAAELSAAGPGWAAMFERARTESVQALISQMRCELGGASTRAEAARALAGFKRRMFFRILVADLLRRMDVAGTMAAMSRLAEECIRAALGAALGLLGERAGAAGEFCVLAMGKLGANELNLSSDIDLVYLFEAPGATEAYAAAARIGELVTELLSPGCFRVDLRLRPGGRNSPLAIPLGGALGFYHNLGQTWERAALLRARPVAGSFALGERLLGELRPFIYRRYLDFDTIRQLRAMKRRIEAELRSPEMVERDLKLGYGGIRELEFFVQALTLIYGGRDPRIRTEETLVALRRQAALGYLPAARAERLAQAYLFLRNVEHKLQAAAGRQTHALPAGEAGMRALAARLGLGKSAEAAAALRRALDKHRGRVAAEFREMLADGEDRPLSASPAAQAAWRSALSPTGAAPALAELGFARAAESAGQLEFLARGPERARTSPRRAELLARLGPALLDEIGALADPDLALRNLAAFIAAVGARTSFLALLEQRPATRRVLLRLFASSSYLSTLFIRHPEMLDTLVRSGLARARRGRDELAVDLSGLVAASPGYEAKLDALRAFRHQEFLRVAIADLAGELDFHAVAAELSLLAEVVLDEALKLARAEAGARARIPAGLALCCLAMGRLGAAEMSYNSDLDLIFVYEGEEAAEGLSGREAAARIVQKLIAILATRTREGYAYRLDLRLRPSGNQGPLVTSLEGFRAYHRRSSALWERQALVRARAVAGDVALAERVEAARQEFVFGRGLSPAEVAEIAAMRARMEREIGPEDAGVRLNLKQGRGGLVDVEFVAQMMALAHGWRHPELRRRSTLEMLRPLGALGLLSPEEALALAEGYEFLSRLENRLRIENDRPAWALPAASEALRPIARRMGYQGSEAAAHLLAELARRRERVRAAFDSCFARERLRAARPASPAH